jgi:hypothetical protein
MKRFVAILSMSFLLVGSLISAALPKADVTQYTYTTELTDCWVYNQCNGEWLVATGSARYVYKLVTDAKGGLHYTWHGNHNLQGVGQSTGIEYQVISSFTEEGNLPYFSLPYEWTRINTSPLIAHGSEVPDMVFTIREHLTINANGDIVVDFSEEIVECK